MLGLAISWSRMAMRAAGSAATLRSSATKVGSCRATMAAQATAPRRNCLGS